MVKYLVDSDILISFLKGRKEAIDLLNKFDPESLAVSVITVAEVLEGLVHFPDEFRKTEESFEKFSIFEISMDVAKKFALLRNPMRKSGNLIDNMDLLIASTALVNNLTLVTNNQKDFKKIKELKISS